MIKTNFTITFFESEICFKINAKFILITNTHPVTFLDLRFLVVLKTQAKKVLSAGIFNGCLRFFLPDEEHYCRMNDHPVECVLHSSCNLYTRITKSIFCQNRVSFISTVRTQSIKYSTFFTQYLSEYSKKFAYFCSVILQI